MTNIHINETQAIEELYRLLDVLPAGVRETILERGDPQDLLEIVLDLGRKPAARYLDEEVFLSDSEVMQAEIDHVVDNIGIFDDDNRAGIERTLHRISGIRNRREKIIGLTCRVGRAIYGTSDIITDIIEAGQSVLLLGRPGVGKTTMLREMARVLSKEKRVVIVDTSNEIGGDGDIPHAAVGRARRMQVPQPSHQHETMIEAVENHNPQVIIIDEIGRELEAAAARTINERGVQLIGTAHGNELENLLMNPTLSDLVGGIESVTLSDEEARRRGTQKTVLERRSPPTFDVLIELQARQRMVIHDNVAASVDAMLRGRLVGVEIRYRDDEGVIRVEKNATVKTTPLRSSDSGKVTQDSNQYENNRPKSKVTEQGAVLVGETADSPAISIFPYGVARNRLTQAAKRLGVRIQIVDEVAKADALVTLKSYYRRRRRIISDAESKKKPVYVLRANTGAQMEAFIAELYGLSGSKQKHDDPFEAGVAEMEEAIAKIGAGASSIDLSPAGPDLRKQQHQMARQAELISHSYGRDRTRHVRVFGTKRLS